jgi:hypothetical protein
MCAPVVVDWEQVLGLVLLLIQHYVGLYLHSRSRKHLKQQAHQETVGQTFKRLARLTGRMMLDHQEVQLVLPTAERSTQGSLAETGHRIRLQNWFPRFSI